MTRPPAAEVVERHSRALMAIDGVSGVFVGATPEGSPCIKVLVRDASEPLVARIPQELEGYPVFVVEGGDIRALDSER